MHVREKNIASQCVEVEVKDAEDTCQSEMMLSDKGG